MSDYILPILILSLGLGCWALFQLWTGRQADGSSIDQDEIGCGECGVSCNKEHDTE